MNPFKWGFWLNLHRDPLIAVVLFAFVLGLCAVLITISFVGGTGRIHLI
jgi:hypothetical protein